MLCLMFLRLMSSQILLRNVERSFAEVLSEHLEGVVDGMHGRADYTPIGKISISDKPSKPVPGKTFASKVDRKEDDTPRIKRFINGRLLLYDFHINIPSSFFVF